MILRAIALTGFLGFISARVACGFTIITPDKCPVPVQTAAKELATYLEKMTGKPYTLLVETQATDAPAPRIWVGPTQFAKSKGVDCAALGPEEWLMRTLGEDLILAGGQPRGTLYAVYLFLEDEVGVRWWNPFEEYVPSKPDFALPYLDKRGKPAFKYRDIYCIYGEGAGQFCARNRLNRNGDIRIPPEFGGCMDYGPPYHVHTFYMYMPPEKYFDQHPEYFSLIKGKRAKGRYQLCLTNPDVRRIMLAKLMGYIETSRQEAAKSGLFAPLVFDVSQNDWGGMCECAPCKAIAEREGSESGPLLDFINFLADGIKDKYPDVFIDTLAYQMTQEPPKTLRPRDNVIIRLCDTTSDPTKPITDPANKRFHDILLAWAKITKNLRIWDYAVTYGAYPGLPLPTVHTYAADYHFYLEHNVEGVFTEHEYPILADMRDLKIWMMIKLLENPYRDYAALLTDFTDGFYGKAGPMIREYLAELEKARNANPCKIDWGASPTHYRYLDLQFITWAQALFDRAEREIQGDATLLRRVRHARLPLDRATLTRFRELARHWVALGKSIETFPIDRAQVAQRAKQTWLEQVALRIPAPQQQAERARAEREIGVLAASRQAPFPAELRHMRPDQVWDYTPEDFRLWADVPTLIPDPDSEVGIAARLELTEECKRKSKLTDDEMKRYDLPMRWGLYDTVNRKSIGSATIKAEDIPGPGYHLYKMGRFPVGPGHYVYFFWSWVIQCDVNPQAEPGQLFDIYARIKFEGPRFPHGKPGQKDAICVERVILVKAPN